MSYTHFLPPKILLELQKKLRYARTYGCNPMSGCLMFYWAQYLINPLKTRRENGKDTIVYGVEEKKIEQREVS
jgi:hypothetical protein